MCCIKCGTEIHGSYRYCPVCGAQLNNPSDTEKPKRSIFTKKITVTAAILIILLLSGIIFFVISNSDKTADDNTEKGKIIYADHSLAESAAYNYAANILLADLPSDYEVFVSSTTVDWNSVFEKLNENGYNYGNAEDAYRDYITSDPIFDSVSHGYSYFEIETVAVTDYPYTELHKNISLFSSLFRPLSLSAVSYIPFSDIRTLNSVILSVEFYDENNNLTATEQLDITVVATSDEYYAPRTYTVLYDDFFLEGFITSLHPENTSTAVYEDGTRN